MREAHPRESREKCHFSAENAKNRLRIGVFVATLRPLVRKDKLPKGELPITWQQAR
jgi:hypothetical protein